MKQTAWHLDVCLELPIIPEMWQIQTDKSGKTSIKINDEWAHRSKGDRKGISKDKTRAKQKTTWVNKVQRGPTLERLAIIV